MQQVATGAKLLNWIVKEKYSMIRINDYQTLLTGFLLPNNSNSRSTVRFYVGQCWAARLNQAVRWFLFCLWSSQLANSLRLGKPFCRTRSSMWLASANLVFGRQPFTFCCFHHVPFALITWNSSSDSIHLEGWFLICNISSGLMFPSHRRLGFFSLKMRSLAEFKHNIRSHDSFHQCVGS